MTMYEQDKVHQFLMGLHNASYCTIRSQILALDPLPSLDRIFNITQQEENHKKIMTGREAKGDSAMAFAVRGQPPMIERGACQICGRYGYEEAACYEEIGYPPSWGSRGRGRGNRGGRSSRGRTSIRGRGQGRENAATMKIEPGLREDFAGPVVITGLESSQSPAANAGPVQQRNPGLTQDQIQKLLSLIDSPKAGFENSEGTMSWMLDSGASCHMASDVSVMDTIEKTAPVIIGLPNGTYTVAKEKGSVALGGGMKLEKVLCVPKLIAT